MVTRLFKNFAVCCDAARRAGLSATAELDHAQWTLPAGCQCHCIRPRLTGGLGFFPGYRAENTVSLASVFVCCDLATLIEVGFFLQIDLRWTPAVCTGTPRVTECTDWVDEGIERWVAGPRFRLTDPATENEARRCLCVRCISWWCGCWLSMIRLSLNDLTKFDVW